MAIRSSYSRIGRRVDNRFRKARFFDSEVNRKRAQARRFSYCYPSRPLRIEDDWPNGDASDADKCKITIYGFKDPPDDHIVEVDCFSGRGYLVKKFPSHNEAREFAEAIQEPVSYDDLINRGFSESP